VATLQVSLTEISDDGFPIFGIFEFTESSGEVVVIREKLPVIGAEYVEGVTLLPVYVKLECSIVSTSDVEVIVDISCPHGIADTLGRTRFRVRKQLVVE